MIFNKKVDGNIYNGDILDVKINSEDQIYFENLLKSKNIKHPYVCINLWILNIWKIIILIRIYHIISLDYLMKKTFLIFFYNTKKYLCNFMGHDVSRFKNLDNNKVIRNSDFREDILDYRFN